MKSCYICLDVGGSEIKAALVYAGEPVPQIAYYPSLSGETAKAIINHLFTIILQTAGSATHSDRILGVGMAFPGPFDYENGVSLMQGLSKYDALYGINLKDALEKRLRLLPESPLPAGLPFRFINDVSAFALGELHFGAAKGAARGMYVCIGTGCGSAFSRDNRLLTKKDGVIPENGYLYPLPYKKGCIDDYLSKRGLQALSLSVLGIPMDGYSLAKQAFEGNRKALQCYGDFGLDIKAALLPFLEAFRPSCLILGGQIMKSAALFINPLSGYCEERGIVLSISADTSLRTLQGLTTIFN